MNHQYTTESKDIRIDFWRPMNDPIPPDLDVRIVFNNFLGYPGAKASCPCEANRYSDDPPGYRVKS